MIVIVIVIVVVIVVVIVLVIVVVIGVGAKRPSHRRAHDPELRFHHRQHVIPQNIRPGR